jgi:hypothetical protein
MQSLYLSLSKPGHYCSHTALENKQALRSALSARQIAGVGHA